MTVIQPPAVLQCGDKLDGEKAVWKRRPMFEDWNLDDPPATDKGDLDEYRRVRDEIRTKVEGLITMLGEE